MEDVSLPLEVMSSEAQDLPEALQAPTKRLSIGFLLAMSLANAALIMCNGAISGILLPQQITAIDPVHKVADLGLVSSAAILLALIGNPLAGAFSDRTTSHFGRRRPWIVGGTIGSVLSMAVLLSAASITQILIGLAAYQLFSNFLSAGLSTLVPDLVPEIQRGLISGLGGIAATVGLMLGLFVPGFIVKGIVPGYLLFIIVLLICVIPFAIFLREKVLPREYVQPFHLGAFLKNFWVNPLQHSDFAWAWLTRFIPFFGYTFGTGYTYFYLQDALHFEKLFPGQSITQGASMLGMLTAFFIFIFTPIGGILSDRFRRRKIFVVIACIILAIGLGIISLIPSWTVLLIAMGVVGTGFGIYFAVDTALITQVLPSANNRAKDMGIINIANTLPQTCAPAVAAFIISVSHSYSMLYVCGATVVLLGVFTVLPIKAVR